MIIDLFFCCVYLCVFEVWQVVCEFYVGVSQFDMVMVVFFCLSKYDFEVLVDELNCLFGDVFLVGCIIVGEIGFGGYCGYSLFGVSFFMVICVVVVGCYLQLQNFNMFMG